MSQKGYKQPPTNEASLSGSETDKGRRPDAGIGDLFRKQREKLGLSHTRISETTRIRPYFLEALENENWETLPSSVFVTGFIRSYAHALGLEQEEIVALFQRYVPTEEPPARPLVEPASYRKAPFVIFVFLLLIMASAYYLWKEYPAHEKVTTVQETKRAEVDKVKNLRDNIGMPHENAPAAGPVSSPPDSSTARLNSTPEPGIQPSDMEPSEDLSGGRESPSQSSIEQTPSHDPVTVPVAGSDLLILKATVRERTYVRMVVDAREPKEYVFRAGSNPQWEAREGFDVLIGNAGGINFEFNGKKIQDLGRTGQVVRLRFPEDINSQE